MALHTPFSRLDSRPRPAALARRWSLAECVAYAMVGLSAVLAMGLVGCSGPSGSKGAGAESADSAGSGATTKGQRFVFAQGPEPRTLDPGFTTDTYSGFLAANLFEGLLVWDAAAKELLPGAAARWETSADGRTWTFYLRQGAIWSNGDPVTAVDFIVAWRRVLDPERGSPYASLLYPIRGARALHSGEAVSAGSLGAEASSQHTLIVELEQATPWFGAILAHHVMSPVNARAVKRHGHAWTRPENIVVNGPFTLAEWTAGERLVLKRNRYFHGVDSVALAEVVAHVETDPEEVLRLYAAGTLHWTGHASGLLPLERLPDLAGRPDAHLHPRLGTAWYLLQTDHDALKDERVRRALSLTLDQRTLDSVMRSAGIPTEQVVPAMKGYAAAKPLAPDADAARELLAAAGFPGGEGFPELELAVDNREVHERVAAWAVAAWQKELGISVRVFSREWNAHSDAMQEGGFDLGRGGWVGDYPDPLTFLELFRSDSEFNYGRFDSKVYDALVNEAMRTADSDSRLRLLHQAEQILVDEAAVIPLFHFGSVELLAPGVEGFVDNAMDVHLLRYLSVKK